MPSGQVAPKFCLHWAILSFLFNESDLVGRRLVRSLGQWTSENEKLHAQKENLQLMDNWLALFSSPTAEM